MSIKEIRFAFAQTIPVLLGYLFLGIAYGLMLQDAGYGWVWALLTSIFIYAGSMQFVLVTLMTGGVSLLYSMVMTLFINGRHIFYGLSFIEKFREMGKAYPYMVFSLTDETYSVQCALKIPNGMRENRIRFLISLFDHFYWIGGSVLGAVIGELLTFDTTGVDFAMTALFVVIVLNQWMDAKDHKPAIIGAIVGVVALVLLGADHFLLPALAVTAAILIGGKKRWNMQ